MSMEALHAALDGAISEGMPAAFKAAGWVYRDFPRGVWLNTERWNEFLRLMGDGNYQILAASTVGKAGEMLHRGQFLISPAGIDNLRPGARVA